MAWNGGEKREEGNPTSLRSLRRLRRQNQHRSEGEGLSCVANLHRLRNSFSVKHGRDFSNLQESFKRVQVRVSATKSELEILTDKNWHPCLMKLKGFCFQYKLAVVYDEKPDKYLSGVLRSGKDFGWDDRMKVATQLTSLFTWLHERQFASGGMEPSSIMIDKDFNIKILNFGFLVRIKEEDNGVLTIPYLNLLDAYEGTRTLKSDVYVFGVLLVGLIAKNANTPYYCWIVDELQRGKRSIVNKSLLRRDYNGELACRITKLAAEYLKVDLNARPDMKDVFANLSSMISDIPRGHRQVMHQSD
ncbi:putative serine/threonine-protein kinase PBL18 [Nicotiana tabacum]|uniref:Serine/threonine-protein kinase PBL18 n=1 Tax=Nicotiana tabacum TaxID=4097 RepID=A0AC58SNI3_TOBAC